MPVLVALFLCSLHALAGLDHLGLKNLNFQYQAPQGSGTVEKISLGFPVSRDQRNENITLTQSGESFLFSSSLVDLTWSSPPGLLLSTDHLNLEGTSFNFGRGSDTLTSVRGEWVPGSKEISWSGLDLICVGESREEDILRRVLLNCHTKMDLNVKKLDLPIKVFLARLSGQKVLQPAQKLKLTSENGKFSLQLYTRIIVSAGLRMNGQFDFEDDFKVLKVRVDRVRFGYLTITDLFFRELKKAGVKVDPPYVTIDLE